MRKIEYKGITLYVTEDGRVFGPTQKERKIKINPKRQNRKQVNTSKGKIYVHILVAKAFPEICGEWFDGCEVHHKDGDATNNNATNLQIVSKKQHWLLHKSLLVQEDVNGKVIGMYTSSLEAQKETGVSAAAIRECLCGNSKTSGGYIWYRKKAS